MTPYLHPHLQVRQSPDRGWGVYTSAHIPADTLIERSPVILMNAEERALLDQTLMHDYIFEWGENSGRCAMAMGYVPIYNHAAPSNAEYLMLLDEGLMEIHTQRDVPANQEIFINYQGDFDNQQPVWFDVY